ncbi:LutB/LldF family L-lactate oxidation iron-sulfur protein [Kocuria rhizophila]|uniref:LutB/LldF family L-lactate oxidation iron-sulfur protein n=1 Tax=Kocuria rhizophila TaxID=72000 RepID=UPI0002F8A1E2|nr:LutB/LldF family L-lactate oxidation iron-sulfur protein [Kocuria rhizophila]MCT1957588.1 LutB/LldF family L-lactate oxidation iron-sulfur protein [Kocuria rhizophila]MCT2073708.1 LutB/LldF family L-lactate oxidation iron-sulfur protein [Kocuria rhizophila]MDR7373123.1 L-lactate dehydrogenase complex protein LldF [Kocuria rhizophila]PKZ38415.1 iron-sulfur cluster-binding protein [Kocuria rhizophila]PMR90857.1 iron-sulfur cluster-binding protein [Kocuria rhizophila]
MSVTSLGMPAVRPVHGQGNLHAQVAFPKAAKKELQNEQMRANIRHATHTIRAKRAGVVGEVPDWSELRDAGSAIKETVMAHLPELLEQFEANVTARGGVVHWARDADEANAIVTRLVQEQDTTDVIKVKSMATQEIGLDEHLSEHGITATETDLAELIVQLGRDKPSHILVPAIHKNREEIREIFSREMPGVTDELTSEPRVLAEAARQHLREKFLTSKVAISGANFGIADTGTLSVVESEGNGRMCLTLPETLITVMGIEKLLPTYQDLEVFFQLLPRSSTGERMNPYTSLWTGVTPGDGPKNFHVVLLDNGRSAVLSDPKGRSALHCIRCSACLNVCPVYEHAGGHSYGSTYPGPIGAILSPQLTGITSEKNASLPYASSLCGACYQVCPVKINIPDILVHLRDEDIRTQHGQRVDRAEPAPATEDPAVGGADDWREEKSLTADEGQGGQDSAPSEGSLSQLGSRARRAGRRMRRAVPSRGLPTQMDAMMKGASFVMSSGQRMSLAERGLPMGRLVAGRDHAIGWLPGMVGGWTDERDIPEPPKESFRNWWKKHEGETDERLARDGVPAASGLQRSGDERAEGSAAASAIPDAPAAEDAAKASRVAETAAGTGDDAATPGAGPDAVAGGQQEATGDPHEDNIDAPNGHAERGDQNGEQA